MSGHIQPGSQPPLQPIRSRQQIRNADRAVMLFVGFVITIATALAGVALFSGAAKAQDKPAAEETQVAFVRPGDMGTGGLLMPSKRPGLFVEAPRLSSKVHIDVSGPIARVTVSQQFKNPSDGWAEGIYVFPLPENSAVDTLRMKIGDREIEGIIKPRSEARKIYETAKSEGRKASLVEQERPNIFTNSVANIGPGETVIVTIQYQQTVEQNGGEFSLRYPMVVAPRYSPRPVAQTVDFSNSRSGWGTVDPVPDREAITPPVLDPRENAKINPVTLEVKLAAGFPLDTVTTPFHEMNVREEDDSTRILTLKNESVPADRDFELVWKAAGTAPNAALFRENVDGQDYVLAFVTPPSSLPADFVNPPREAIFVIDNSGSMAGESIVQAKQALETALRKLTPADRFNVIRFDNTMEMVFRTARRADGENLQTALRFVRSLEAEGGTEMLPALEAALSGGVVPASGEQHVRQVVFITDGAIGNEQQLFDVIGRDRGNSRVFTIGIGSAPNSHFMRRAAEIGRGTFTHIGSVNQVAEKMNEFLARLENPVMTNLAVDGAELSDASPDPLPDLYEGEPVVLAAKIDDPDSVIEITGDFAGKPWAVSMDVANAAKGEGVAKLWARRKIASLEASRSFGGRLEAVDQKIEKVALEHHLVSRLTSLVAVDVTQSRPDGEYLTSKKVPLNLPEGWDPEAMFDEAEEAAAAPVTRSFARQTASLMQARPAAEAPQVRGLQLVQIQQPQNQVALPPTATNADRNLMIGLFLIFLAAMLVVVDRLVPVRTGRHSDRRFDIG